MKTLTLTLVAALLLWPPFKASAAPVDSRTARLQVYFDRRTGVTDASALSILSEMLASGDTIKTVTVTGWASPDGLWDNNVRLSVARADTVAVRLRAMLPASAVIRTEGRGEQWGPVEECLDTIPSSVVTPYLGRLRALMDEAEPDRREWMLRQVGGGAPWAAVAEASYARCRYVDVKVTYIPAVQPVELPAGSPSSSQEEQLPADAPVFVAPAPADTIRITTPSPAEMPQEDALFSNSAGGTPESASPAGAWEKAPFYRCAFRTNLLMPGTNLGFVLHVGRGGHSSIAVDAFGPWLGEALPKGYRFDVAGAGLEYRYWLREATSFQEAMTGWSFGLGVLAALWDVQWKGPGSQGEGWTVSFDGSWAVRAGSCRFMFTLGLGGAFARWRPYRTYEDDDRLYRLGEWHKDLKWFGPVRAGVTLIVPFAKVNR